MEVADAQLAGLVAAQQLLQRMWQTPEGRSQVLSASRDAGFSPEAQIAADEAKRIEALVDARVKPIEDARKADIERAEKADADRASAAVASKEAEAKKLFGLTDKGIELVRQLQKERGIADPRDAAELLVARGAPELASPGAEPLRQPETAAQKARSEMLRKDPLSWARLEMQDGLREIRRTARSEY